MSKREELFTRSDLENAIKQWLEFGEQYTKETGKGKYFSGNGWAARVLRASLMDLKKSTGD